MATNKTIQPSGETIVVPDFDEKPDARIYSQDLSKLADNDNLLNQALSEQSDKWFTAIPNGANLNSYTTPGFYGCINASTAATLVNSPITNSGLVMSVQNKGGTVVQIVTSGESMCMRAQYSSGFSNWQELAMNSGIITDSLTPGTGVSIAMQRKLKIGNLVTYNLAITTTEQTQPHVSLVTGFEQHNGGYNGVPTILSFNNSSATAIFYLHDDGSLRAVSAFGASTWRMSFSYICN